jgi:hypothetical protein
MHKQLEDYLTQVEKILSPLPAARRAAEMKEMRQHLLNAVEVSQRAGQSEDQAVADALQQFGAHQELGKSIVSVWRREGWRQRVREAPEVAAFGVFSVVITVSNLWLTFAGPMQWREALAPYIGGSLSMPYMFSLFFAWSAIFAPKDDVRSRRAVMAAPVGMLLLYAAFGAGEYLWLRHLPDFHNPYLSANPWQPVWTVALPLAWALVIGGGDALRKHKTRQQAA